MAAVLKMIANSADIDAGIAEAERLMERLGSDLPASFRESFLDALYGGLEASLEPASTVGANEVILRLKLPKRCHELLATLRTKAHFVCGVG